MFLVKIKKLSVNLLIVMIMGTKNYLQLLVLLFSFQIFAQTGDQYANVQFTQGLENGNGKISIYVYVENEYDGHWDYLRSLDIDVSIDGGEFKPFGFIGLQKQSDFHDNIEAILFDSNSYSGTYGHRGTEYELKTGDGYQSLYTRLYFTNDNGENIGDYVVPRHFEDTNSQVAGTPGGADRVQIDVYPHHIERFKYAKTIRFRTRGEYLENFFDYDDWDHYPSDRRKEVGVKYTKEFDISNDQNPNSAKEEAWVNFTNNNIRTPDGDLTIGVNLEYFDNHISIRADDYDHVQYLDIDYSEDGGNSWNGFAYVRYNGFDAENHPWSTRVNLHDNSKNKQDYNLYYSNIDNEVVNLVTQEVVEDSFYPFVDVDNNDEGVDDTYKTISNRLKIKIPISKIPRLQNLETIKWRVRGRYYDTYNGVSKIIDLPNQESENFNVKEEDNSGQDEIGFEANFNVNEGSTSIVFRLTKTSDEIVYDHVACSEIGKIIRDKDGNIIKDEIIGYVNHKAGILGCNDKFNSTNSKDFTDEFGDSYRYGLKYDSMLMTPYGANYWTKSGEDTYVVIRDFIQQENYGNSVEYYIAGSYYAKDLNGAEKVGFNWYNNKSNTFVVGDEMKIPSINIDEVKVSASSDCQIDITWDAPSLSIGNIDNYYVQVLRNEEEIARVDADGGINEFNDTTISAGVDYNYSIRLIYQRNYFGKDYASLKGQKSLTKSAKINLLDAPSGLSSTQTGCDGNIEISWFYTENPSSFRLEKQKPGGKFEVLEANINGGLRSFVDTDVVTGEVYKYRIAAIANADKCNAIGLFSPVFTHSKDTQDITPVFDNITFGLETSKGYFNNRTELEWTPNLDTEQFIHQYKIYTREFGSTITPRLITTLNVNAKRYDHLEGSAGKIYEYFVVGERVIEDPDCGRQVKTSFEISSLEGILTPNNLANGVGYNVGLRIATGVVNGNITYTGGVSVPNVKVVAERQDGNAGKSLVFNNNESYVELPASESFDPQDDFSLSFWVKPEVAQENMLFRTRQFSVRTLANGQIFFSLNGQEGGYAQVITDWHVATEGKWTQVTVTYNNTTKDAKIYYDGKYWGSKNVGSGFSKLLDNNNHNMYIGGEPSNTNSLVGKLDEIRLYHRVLSSEEIERESGKHIASDAEGLTMHLKVFEGLGNKVYDLAYKGDKFFKNQGVLKNATFSDDIPTATQLGNVGYTDEYGNYTIESVEYKGTGENFNIIPTATLGGAVHEFDPGRKTLFIGEGATINNEIDFEDISSFRFSGFVRFDFEDTVGGGVKSSGSAGIKIYLDGGSPLTTDDNKVFETDEDGFFDVQIPIGNHFVEFRKNKHVFKNGRFPLEGTHDFQEEVTGLEIIDETKHILSGRIVGGIVESSKPLFRSYNPSVNNIGQAKFILTSKDKKIVREVTTTADTGEFTIELPPKEYTSSSVKWVANDAKIINSGDIKSIKLGSIVAYNGTQEKDSVFNNENEFERIDSVFYNIRKDFTYRTLPELVVTDTLGGVIKNAGEDKYLLDQKDKKLIINLSSLRFPSFRSTSNYAFKIKAVEKYTNLDNNQLTVVPVSDGEITVNNGVGTGYFVEEEKKKSYGSPEKIQLDKNGELVYLFKAGEPNINENSSAGLEHLSYTKQISMTLQVGDIVTYWPNASDQNETQRAYVFGGKQQGANFVTKAPPVVDFVLRDPPGSNSYSYLTKESSFSTSTEFSAGGFLNIGNSVGLGVGMNTLVGGGIVGVGEVAEGKILGTLGFNVNFNLEAGGEFNYETSFNETIQTNGDPIQVGRSDVFVAKSQNMMTGTGVHIRPVPIELCGGNCFGDVMTDDNGKQYKMTRVLQSYLNPVGSPTFFIFSQNHIENVLIPDLKEIRNSFLTKENSRYTSKISVDHPNFGTNNDDPVWGSSASSTNAIKTELKDFNGSSYVYSPSGDINKAIDSVRAMNQQIRLWKEALANNEIQKWLAKKYRGAENVSLSSGVSLERSSTESFSGSSYISMELQTSVSMGAKVEFDGYGVAVESEINTEIGRKVGFTQRIGGGSSKTIGYVLNDPDEDDALSINIYGGEGDNGPIFLTQAGQTSCPFEDKIVMKYATVEYIETLIAINQGQKNKAEEEAKAFGLSGATDEETKKYGKATQINADLTHLKTLLAEVKAGEVVLSNKTLQRDKPKLQINGAKTAQAFNVPADEAANFNLSLINAGEAGDPQYFAVKALDETNPNGLEMTIDGQSINTDREFLVQGGGGIQKLLKVRRGPNHYDYDNVGVVIKSTCQADPTGNDAVLSDTIYFNVKYLPVCTDLKINSPTDKWTVNNSFNNKLPITIGEYDVNKVGFEEVKIQYKPISSSEWTLLTTYFRNEDIRTQNGGANDAPLLPTNGNSFTYEWELGSLPDGDYDIRALSKCALAENVTEIFSGTIDRTNPVPFGLPQPSDGILSPGEEPSVQFNETINGNLLSPANFDIRGVLNGGKIRHSSSVAFAGTSNSYVEVEEIDFVNSPFTIDFYAKREKDNAEQILIAHGNEETEELLIGFNASNQIFFKLGGRIVTGVTTINNDWHHYAVTYDPLNKDVIIYFDGQADVIDNSFEVSVKLGEKLLVGKSPRINGSFFTGKMHELRVWSKPLTVGEVNIYSTQKLIGNEAGLLHNWEMEEANGVLALDKVRSKHAKMNAAWVISPLGYALKLNGNVDQANATPVTFDNTTDFTIEFWFKSNGGTNEVLLSNGKGDGIDVNTSGWTIGIDAEGKPYAQSNGQKMTGAISVNNNKWHHIAIVTNARGNSVLYINAEEQEKIDASNLDGFGGSALWIGQQGWFDGSVKKTGSYFTGSIDELRIWNASISLEELSRDRFNMLSGDEPGLIRYYSFETYVDNSGVVSVTSTTANKTLSAKSSEEITLTGGAILNQDTPTIKLKRPVEFVNFSYVVNNDKIIITINAAPSKIENVRLDFTIKDVKDLNGNSIQSPIKWSAFIDRNQVIWQHNAFALETDYQKELVFESKVVNNSGESKSYNITNIPQWLEVTPSSGTIGPLSTSVVKFKVAKDVNVGEYNEDILLSTTDFGFAEKLNVKVKKALPEDWEINPNNFEYSMNVIGQISIDGIISRDDGNILGVFVGNECRGLANLKHVGSYDNYQAFLTIYSNVSTGEQLEFRIWEHKTGTVYSSLNHNLPSNIFTADTYHGTSLSPKLFSTTNIVSGSIDVVNGWRWIAFNLNGTDLSGTNNVLKNLSPDNGDIIKTRINLSDGNGGFVQESLFDTYSSASNVWSGSLSNKGALNTGVLYKINLSQSNKIKYQGSIVDLLKSEISLVEGWNYIGYLGNSNIPINEALSNLNAKAGDLIKSQYYSAIYDENHGWLGTLKVLSPNEGYMIRTATAQGFKYPSYNSTSQKGKSSSSINKIENVKADAPWNVSFEDYENNMTIIAQINNNDLSLNEGVLGAFINGVCKGFAAPIYNKELGENVYFINVGTKENVGDIQFKYLNNTTQIVYNINENIEYKIDQVVGSITQPIMLTPSDGVLYGEKGINLYPNPAKDQVFLSIPIEKDQVVKLELFNGNGKKVFTRNSEMLNKGKHTFSINTQDLSIGVYHLSITLNSGLINKKLVIIK